MSGTIQQVIDNEAPADMRFPRVSHVVTIAPVSLEDRFGATFDAMGRKVLSWHLHKPHPLMVDKLTVVRMYRRPTGIKIYSAFNDGKSGGVLDFIPMSQILLVSALMDPVVLIYELGACESGTDEDSGVDDPEDEPEEPEEPEPEHPTQTATS